MKIFREEDGQTLVLTVLCMTILLGFMALAVDVGMMFRARRSLQAAADAAAVAAAIEMGYHGNNGLTGGSNNVTAAADAAAASNGVTDATQVAVNNPVTNGYHTGSGYVEVVITQPNPTFFMGMFGRSTMNVMARAVGGDPASVACGYVLDNKPSDIDTLWTQKTITSTNCGWQVNSPNANAVCLHGSGTIVSDYLHIVGGMDGGHGCKPSKNAPMQEGVAPVADPFNDLTGPNPSKDCTTGNTFTGATIATASQLPASTPSSDNLPSDQIYCFKTAAGTAVTLQNGLVLGPGIYVFVDGVTLGNNTAVTVNGGTLDVAGGVYSQATGNATHDPVLSITAPTTGLYNSIALMQPSTNTQGGTCGYLTPSVLTPCPLSVQFGSSTNDLNGIIYAPTSAITLHDNGGKNWSAAGIIAWTITTNDAITITNNYNLVNPSTTPLKKITLVE